MKVLIAGWFSFEQMGASAGDLMARDLVCNWLSNAGLKYEMATASPFTGGVDWQQIDPTGYQAIVFVCGPFGNGPPITEFLLKFDNIPLIGNLDEATAAVLLINYFRYLGIDILSYLQNRKK